MRKPVSWVLAGVLMFGVSRSLGMGVSGEEFVRPFPSWANVKIAFGAVGDGKADDTTAIRKALETVRRQDFPKKVLYFPAGPYRITATLKPERISHHAPLGMSITGEDPEKTIIKWDGADGQSMFPYNLWYASMSRLTIDGGGAAKTVIQHGVAFSTTNEFTDMIIKDVKPEPVAFLPRPDRPIVKVAASVDVATILGAIDAAAAMKGKRPVVHLPKANYTIGKMLVIPAGTDLQLVGDGPEDATQFANAGGANPLIRVLSPSHATFHNFLADAGKAAVCIQVANCDQAGACIFGEQLHTPSGMSTVWSPTTSRTLVWNYVTIATTASR